jgi:hypothetical protein
MHIIRNSLDHGLERRNRCYYYFCWAS